LSASSNACAASAIISSSVQSLSSYLRRSGIAEPWKIRMSPFQPSFQPFSAPFQHSPFQHSSKLGHTAAISKLGISA
jgi:hypothetical protein